jgi:hypothetical protein
MLPREQASLQVSDSKFLWILVMASRPRSNSGKQLQREWKIPAQHVLYHHKGAWFHLLERFPGALCDSDGYVLFETDQDFRNCAKLRIGKHVKATQGLKSIRGYTVKSPPLPHLSGARLVGQAQLTLDKPLK